MMQASLHGRLGRDPKEIQTSTGTTMAVAPVAVSVPLSKGDDTETQWFDIVCFGRVAELLLRHSSGEMLNAFGNVQINRWTDQNGEVREQLQIIADSIISARSTRPAGTRQRNTPQRHGAAQRAQAPADFDDDLEF